MLSNGKKLVEGDFTVQEVARKALRSQLQKFEIVACLHEDGNIRLKCTGAENANHRFHTVAVIFADRFSICLYLKIC